LPESPVFTATSAAATAAWWVVSCYTTTRSQGLGRSCARFLSKQQKPVYTSLLIIVESQSQASRLPRPVLRCLAYLRKRFSVFVLVVSKGSKPQNHPRFKRTRSSPPLFAICFSCSRYRLNRPTLPPIYKRPGRTQPAGSIISRSLTWPFTFPIPVPTFASYHQPPVAWSWRPHSRHRRCRCRSLALSSFLLFMLRHCRCVRSLRRIIRFRAVPRPLLPLLQ